MPTCYIRAGRALLVTGAAILAQPTLAQQTLVAAPDPGSDISATDPAGSGTSGDILVTARRRTERSQDVPIAINAFGSAQIESTRTYNLRDLQQLTPSLVVTNTNPRNTSINIRGSATMWRSIMTGWSRRWVSISTASISPGRDRPCSTWPIWNGSRFCAGRRALCSARTPPQARWWSRPSCRPSTGRRAVMPAWAITTSASFTPSFPVR